MENNPMFDNPEIQNDYLFCGATLDNLEGFLFFELKEDSENGGHILDPKIMIVDDATFKYTEDLEQRISILSLDNKITFLNREGNGYSVPVDEIVEIGFAVKEMEMLKKMMVDEGLVSVEG